MTKDQFTPVKPMFRNVDLRGGATDSPASSTGKIADLPAFDDGETIITVWKLVSIWQRILFLFTGKITVRVLGRKLQPLAVMIGDTTKEYKDVVIACPDECSGCICWQGHPPCSHCTNGHRMHMTESCY